MAEDEVVTGVIPLEDLIGANSVSVQQITLFIPNEDEHEKPIPNFDAWVEMAVRVLSKMGGGATIIPGVSGAWLNPKTEKIQRESTHIIFSFLTPGSITPHLGELRAFIHRFGYDTGQGQVLFQFGRKVYKVENFDPPPA